MAAFSFVIHAQYVGSYSSIEFKDYGHRYAEWSGVTLFPVTVEAEDIGEAYRKAREPLFADGWAMLCIDEEPARVTRPRFVPLAA